MEDNVGRKREGFKKQHGDPEILYLIKDL